MFISMIVIFENTFSENTQTVHQIRYITTAISNGDTPERIQEAISVSLNRALVKFPKKKIAAISHTILPI